MAAEIARGKAAPAESCYPYTETDGTCADACPNWQASAVKAADWNWVTAPNKRSDIEALKTALNTYGPLSVTMVTYYDFFFYRKGVYSRTSNQLMGHHAVLLIGYDDVEKLFIAKNSWGAGWGEARYFRLSYDTVTDCQGECLRPQGKLIMATPSEDSFASVDFWDVLDMPPHHVTRWTDRCFRNAARLLDLRCVAIEHEPLPDRDVRWCARLIAQYGLARRLGRTPTLLDPYVRRWFVRRGAKLPASLLRRAFQHPALRPHGHAVVAVFQKQ